MVSASEPSTRAAVRALRRFSAIFGGAKTLIRTLADRRVRALLFESRHGVRRRSPPDEPAP